MAVDGGRGENSTRAMYPQEQILDRETIERWRREAVTAHAQDRLWLNRCEALCNALRRVNALPGPSPAAAPDVTALAQTIQETILWANDRRAKDDTDRRRYRDAINALAALLAEVERLQGRDDWYAALAQMNENQAAEVERLRQERDEAHDA